MDEPKAYKPKIRILKSVDGGARSGTQPKAGGHTLRKRQLLSRAEAHTDRVLDELQTFKAEVARLRGLLMAVVLTHGEQAFDLEFLEESCTTGAIAIEFRAPGFAVVKLQAPKVVEPPPDFPKTDDPFVANLSPDARIAYEAAYAKAMEEQSLLLKGK